MSDLSSWVLSIAGICVISVLLDLFMPDGETNGYIKSIVNFAIILVILMPLPNLLKKEININDFLQSEEIVMQEDFLYQLNKNKIVNLETDIENSLSSKGLEQIDILISADIFAEKLEIEFVFVDLTNLVILHQDKHINIEKEVIASVTSYIDIEKEKIVFNE